MHRFWKAAVTWMLAAAIAAGCGSGAPSDKAPQNGQSSASGPKGTLTLAQGVDTNTLDPQMANSTADTNIWMHLFETLTWLNFETGKIEPMLATSWKQLDNLTWEFALRKGVKFHNGKPFSAEAVKFTLERYMDPKVKATGRFIADVPVDRVELVDESTVRIKTKKPVPLMLDYLRYLYILEPSAYQGKSNEEASRMAVGTGPFRLVKWTKDEQLVMEAFTDHWRGAPKLKTIVWRPIPETATRLSELEAKGVDLIVNVPPDQAARIEGADGLAVATIQGGRDIFIGLNTNYEYLKDKRVRQALNYAVDVDKITKNLLGGYGQRISSVANPPNTNEKLKPYPYDPEKAKALLKEAGVPQGWGINLGTPAGRYMRDKEVAQAVAADLEKVGVKVTVNAREWSVYSGQLSQKKVDPMYLLGLGGYFNGQAELLWIHPRLSIDNTFWQNADFLKAYEELEVTADLTKRKQLTDRLQEIALDDAPWIFLYKQFDVYGVNKRVKNWKPRPDEYIVLYDVSVEG